MKNKIPSILIGIFIALNIYFWLPYIGSNVIINLPDLVVIVILVVFVAYIILEKVVKSYYKLESKNIFRTSMISSFIMIFIEGTITFFKDDYLYGICVFVIMCIVLCGIIALRLFIFFINKALKDRYEK